jgi:hypothetical protein
VTRRQRGWQRGTRREGHFCRLCEQLCGLKVEVAQGVITRIRADRGGIIEAVRAGQSDGSIASEPDADTRAREILSTAIGYAYWWIVESDFDLPAELTRWAERLEAQLRSPTDARVDSCCRFVTDHHLAEARPRPEMGQRSVCLAEREDAIDHGVHLMLG